MRAPSLPLAAMTILYSAAHAQSVMTTILGETPGSPNGVPATSVGMNAPAGVASDGKGNVYVALRGAHQVVRIDSSGILWLATATGALCTHGSAGDEAPSISTTLS